MRTGPPVGISAAGTCLWSRSCWQYMAQINPTLTLHDRAVRIVFIHTNAIQPGIFLACRQAALTVAAAMRPYQTGAAVCVPIRF